MILWLSKYYRKNNVISMKKVSSGKNKKKVHSSSTQFNCVEMKA